MKISLKNSFFLILILIFVICSISCKWYSLDFLFGDDGGESDTGPSIPLGIKMISIAGGTVCVQPADVAAESDDYYFGSFHDVSTTPVNVTSFRIAETELTYEKWREVYEWATDPSRGNKKYTFANEGQEGNNGTAGAPALSPGTPVLFINWHDAIVWCNAASEREKLTPVYTYHGAVIRTSDSSTEKNADCNPNANGYRLPTAIEWEYAARGGSQYLVDEWGKKYAGTDNNLSAYAVYGLDDSTDSIAVVKTKAPNAAGLYDMTGNAAEWIWDDEPVTMGGNWYTDSLDCRITERFGTFRNAANKKNGLRIAQNASTNVTLLGLSMKSVSGATVNGTPQDVTNGISNGDYTEGTWEYGAFYEASNILINPFIIAETELTYSEWYEVVQWATSSARGSKKYSFANLGRQGSGNGSSADSSVDGKQPDPGDTHPVTYISWRDAIVWCNAASEREGLEPVYYLPGTSGSDFGDSSKVLRVADDYTFNGVIHGTAYVSHTIYSGTDYEPGNGRAENAVINAAATGYRLPTSKEWEFAARGADTVAAGWSYKYAGSDTLSTVGYQIGDGTDSVMTIKSKTPNAAGLYDMSGNAAEWVQDTGTSGYTSGLCGMTRGGSVNSGDYCCTVAYQGYSSLSFGSWDVGFRLARTLW